MPSHGNHDVSFCNLAVAGATTEDVWLRQISHAVDHRPSIPALVVGLNDDTLRSDWHPQSIREGPFQTADALAWSGAVLLTVSLVDHSRVFGLPRMLARPLRSASTTQRDLP